MVGFGKSWELGRVGTRRLERAACGVQQSATGPAWKGGRGRPGDTGLCGGLGKVGISSFPCQERPAQMRELGPTTI